MVMLVTVEMPKLGLTMEEGTVVEWLKVEGEAVERGEPLFVLETDKITIEATAPESGILGQILIAPGTTVPTGTAVGLILVADEAATIPADLRPEPAPAPKARATPVARRLADRAGLDLDTIAGTGPGGRVTASDVEEVQARVQAGDAPAAPVPVDPLPPAAAAGRPKIKASPRARELAKEVGLDLTGIEGTGREGRVMAQDVQRALDRVRAAPPGLEAGGQIVPLAGVRGAIARHMAASAQTTAAVTTTSQADATELSRLREALREEWQMSLGLAPTYSDLLLVILAKALGEFPYMNAHLIDGQIHQLESINIGLAVDTGRGLVVPVLRELKGRPLAGVARASRELVVRAREGTLLPDDLQGGTFTLSNMGRFDVDASTPIIHLPQCAILGVGRIAPRPAVLGGALCVRKLVTLSLTYDHRAIDGGPAARFLERVKGLIEQPYLALVR
jgi:pyruvate dehydrogenase E2 component (dihydrolipoamide acetyltransferase)